MASGTKILLAVLALIAIGVFVYYATIPQGNGSSDPEASEVQTAEPSAGQPGGGGPDMTGEGTLTQAAPPALESQTPLTAPPIREEAPVASGQPPLANMPAGGGGLGDSIRRALTGAEPGAAEDGPSAPPSDGAEDQKPTDHQGAETGPTPGAASGASDARDKPEEKPSQPPSTSDQKPPAESEGDKPPAQPPASPAPPEYSDYVVKSGDSLSSIAGEWFGDPNKWDLIFKANPDIDKDNLDIGQKLRLPPKDATREAIRSPRTGGVNVHVVGSGDTLSGIAKAYYGNPDKWRIIYEANKSIIGPDPNDLNVGMKLTIPPAPGQAE